MTTDIFEDLRNRPAWQADGICAQTDPAAFYPKKGESAQPAKEVCASCPVKSECLAWAIEHRERFGIWGGLGEKERRRLGKGLPTHRGPTPEQEAQIRLCRAAGLSRAKTAAQVGVTAWTVQALEEREAA